jgi:hypothetical protein
MFCPRCGTENNSQQGYCRQCGLSLPAINLALTGHLDEALSKFKSGSGSLSGGAIILIIGLLNALANSYFAAWQSAAISAAMGSAIGVPLIAVGMARVSRAKRLLSAGEGLKGLKGADEGARELPSEGSTKTLKQGQVISGSVTEHTTLKLEQSKATGER